MRPIVGVDCDGVLSNFDLGARCQLHQLFKKPNWNETGPHTWNFEYSETKFTDEELKTFWKEVDRVPDWWTFLAKYRETELLQEVMQKCRVYFITNRKGGSGRPIEEQTVAWLKTHFGDNHYNVIISDEKGPLAAGLKLEYFIDDRPKNVLDVLRDSPQTRVYLHDASWNQECMDVQRVKTFDEFAHLILGDIHYAASGIGTPREAGERQRRPDVGGTSPYVNPALLVRNRS